MKTKIKNWIDKNINKNLTGKNVFITGANSGIGFELAKECAYLKANIYMLVRNIEKASVARQELIDEYPNTNVELIKLDLSDFSSIKTCVDNIKNIDVDYFINNAGVYRLETQYTKNNLEITMGTNYIGVFYLNNLLNEYFITLNHKVTSIFTTSITSKIYDIDYDDFYSINDSDLIKRYGRSKRALNDMFYYYKDKYKDKNIIFSLVHPGATYTPLINKAYKNKLFQKASKIFMNLIFHTADKASLVDLYAIKNDNGCFVGPRGLLEMSGYPKEVKFKRSSNYLKTIDIGINTIKEITK